jgi:hypothetical protein
MTWEENGGTAGYRDIVLPSEASKFTMYRCGALVTVDIPPQPPPAVSPNTWTLNWQVNAAAAASQMTSVMGNTAAVFGNFAAAVSAAQGPVPVTEPPFTRPLATRKAVHVLNDRDLPFSGVGWHPAKYPYGREATAVCHKAWFVKPRAGCTAPEPPPGTHDAPAEDCTCGFYALADPREGGWNQELNWIADTELWGDCVEHERGYRFARQRVTAVRPRRICGLCKRELAEKFYADRTGFIGAACDACGWLCASPAIRALLSVQYVRDLLAPVELDLSATNIR